jgi:hypothetical protein
MGEDRMAARALTLLGQLNKSVLTAVQPRLLIEAVGALRRLGLGEIGDSLEYQFSALARSRLAASKKKEINDLSKFSGTLRERLTARKQTKKYELLRDTFVVNKAAGELLKTIAEAQREVERVVEEGSLVSKDGGATQDYVLATEIKSKHTPPGVVLDLRRLKRFLTHAASIRTMRPLGRDGTPRMNRLLVHLGDWYKHRDALIEWDKAERNPLDVEAVSQTEAAERLAEVRRRKQRRT